MTRVDLAMETLLTRNKVKDKVYSRDRNFTDAVRAILDVLPLSAKRNSFLWNHAALLLRPEAIVARRYALLLPALREHGLIPVSARLVHLAPTQIEMLWLYQLNVMTMSHVNLLCRLLSIQPSIYLLLKDHTARASAPATTHLTYLKGPTLSAKRRRLHLRSLAGPSFANIISYIHAPDDPADLLREIAVLFPAPEFQDVLAEALIGEDRTDRAISLIRSAEQWSPPGLDLLDPQPPGHEARERADCEGRRRLWSEILHATLSTRSYTDGETYDVRSAIIPDGKDDIAPLDNHLVFPCLGPGFPIQKIRSL